MVTRLVQAGNHPQRVKEAVQVDLGDHLLAGLRDQRRVMQDQAVPIGLGQRVVCFASLARSCDMREERVPT